MIPMPWSDRQISQAATMWNEGASVASIGSTFGFSKGSASNLIGSRRDLFPMRTKPETVHRVRSEAPKQKPAPKPANFSPTDRVTRVTITGAKVTMPRVTYIDGTAAAEAIMEAAAR